MPLKKNTTHHPKKAGIIRMSFYLLRGCLSLFRKNPLVGVFPMFYWAATSVSLVAFMLTFGVSNLSAMPARSGLLLTFLFIFHFLTALMWSASIYFVEAKMTEKRETIGGAAVRTFEKLWKIAAWSLAESVVVVLVWYVTVLTGHGGNVRGAFLGIFWWIATIYVLPPLLFGNKTVGGAIRDSFFTVERVFIETAIVNFFFVFLFALVAFPFVNFLYVLALLFGGVAQITVVAFPVFYFFSAAFILASAAMFVFASAMMPIINIVLYRYAKNEDKDFFHALTPVIYKEGRE